MNNGIGKPRCDKCRREIEAGEKLYAKGKWPDGRYKKVLCETCAIKDRKKPNFIYKGPKQ
jgi:hypothetical protein